MRMRFNEARALSAGSFALSAAHHAASMSFNEARALSAGSSAGELDLSWICSSLQ